MLSECLAAQNRDHAIIVLERLRAVAKHIDPSVTKLETLAWLTLLIIQQGTAIERRHGSPPEQRSRSPLDEGYWSESQ
jgi:hypothetical protein